jgi:hypothetical protein
MAREDRAEAVQQERRRRRDGTLDRMSELTLAVPEKVRTDHPNHTFRWVNDTGNRMHRMTVRDDWDKVEGVAPIPVGTDKEGKPLYAHLCMKPLEFWDEDQKARMDALRERERGLVRAAKSDPQDNRSEDVAYAVPGNTITTGYQP